MCCKCCSVKQQKICVFSVGILLMILGVVLITASPTLSEQFVYSMLPLSPDSFMFSKWVITPVPLYLSFYLYNWTNPHLVNDTKVKPNFVEMGPYVFREMKVKEDLHWDNNENLVTYYGRRTWYFEASKSNGSLDDMITAPHLPTVAGAKIFRNAHPVTRKILNYCLNREGGKLFMTHKPLDWIFNGIYDDIMDFGERLHSPRIVVKENYFGYFYKRNNSKEAEGTFSIDTGKGDITRLGDLRYWNGSNHTSFWEGECGRVNGSTGEIWAPGKKWHEPVSIFLSDAARYVNIYPQTNETYKGVSARRYTTTELTFDSGYIAEDTKCFCVPGRECPKNGVIDYSRVTFKAPVYLSHPHFYMADPLYRENTTGLKPDPEKHSTYLVLEPKLGIPLNAKGRVLISAFVERDEKVDILRDLAWNFYAPLFATEMSAEITENFLSIVKLILNLSHIGQYCGIAFTILGLILICIGIYLTKKHKWHGEDFSKDNYNK
ncbi:protein croquemort [Lucilia sericata]|uniref:protein croquemort n=1 Tax=Lucilia sericata TaxID=13632 RepID=UPI0018A84E10|nr:protein croquemort [Lucilia sericata]